LLKTPLTTLKHLERANQTLGELADSEQKLQDAGKKLIEALSSARQKQEQLSQAVIAHAPTLQARNARLRELMNEMGALAQDVAGINTLVAAKNGDQQAEPDTGEVSAKVLELSERAAQLATTAREAEFPELDEQAHALHQRLKSVGQKLQKAGGN
jgi:DNA repair exonuclease SbcCD ATPase subunit